MRKTISTLMVLFMLAFPGVVGADRIIDQAQDIKTDITNFNSNLSSADTDAQKALETLDNILAGHTDGANCSAGNYPLGVDANGVVQSCTAVPFAYTLDDDCSTNDRILSRSLGTWGCKDYSNWDTAYTHSQATGNAHSTELEEINTTNFTQGSIPFIGASNLEEDNANLFWDDSNDRLGIGTASPNMKLHILGGAGGANDSWFKIERTTSGYEGIAYWGIDTGGHPTLQIGTPGREFRFHDSNGGTPIMTLTDSGNVLINYGRLGIGTVTPATPLDVSGIITASGGFDAGDSNITNVADIALDTISDDAGVENTLSIANLNTAYDHSQDNDSEVHKNYIKRISFFYGG